MKKIAKFISIILILTMFLPLPNIDAVFIGGTSIAVEWDKLMNLRNIKKERID